VCNQMAKINEGGLFFQLEGGWSSCNSQVCINKKPTQIILEKRDIYYIVNGARSKNTNVARGSMDMDIQGSHGLRG
jgi:hypothetical protein